MCKCCSVVSLLAEAEEKHVQAQETLVLEVPPGNIGTC